MESLAQCRAYENLVLLHSSVPHKPSGMIVPIISTTIHGIFTKMCCARVPTASQMKIPLATHTIRISHQRRGWEILIVCVASGIFIWLAVGTRAQHIFVNIPWMVVLMIGTIIPLGLCGTLLWRRTRFS